MTGGGSAGMQGTAAAMGAQGTLGGGRMRNGLLANPSQVYIDPTAAKRSNCCAFSLFFSEFGNFGFPAVNKKFLN